MATKLNGRIGDDKGQSIVEYLVIAMTVIAALVALNGPIHDATQHLAEKTNYQLQHASGTADFLFP